MNLLSVFKNQNKINAYMINYNKVPMLGETIDQENFPKLYKWAKENPEILKIQLKSIADKLHEGSIVSVMQALESDLEHG